MCLVMAEQHEKCINKRCGVWVVLVIFNAGKYGVFRSCFLSAGQKALSGARMEGGTAYRGQRPC